MPRCRGSMRWSIIGIMVGRIIGRDLVCGGLRQSRFLPIIQGRSSKKPLPSRSSRVSEVTGYHLEAQDGEIGHVEDFVIADGDWVIQYLVIDTRNWWPGKKVLLPPQWAVRVDWEQSRVQALLGRVAIKQAPEYDPSVPITREYEARLFGYYNQQPYWERRLAA